ncbi:MAG TPA: hypothetical protein VGI73_05065 [Solirubrobacterales bacterium]|jgi:hypothetical protein
MPHRRRRVLRVPLLALALAALALVAFAAPAGAEVVYDNSATAAEAPSLAFAETGTAELGSLVRLTGTARLDPTVQVGIVNSGEPISAPLTLSVYAVAPGLEPGELLARETQSFELAAGSAVQPIELSLAGVALPDEAIVSVAFDSAALGLALAGPPVAGANPREAEGVYRAAAPEGEADDEAAAGPLGFEAAPLTWQGRQPALAVEASPAPVVATPAPAPAQPTAAWPPSRPARPAYTVPPSKRMSLSFPRSIARIAGPGALVQVKCSGSSAARCIGTLALSAAGAVHKAPYSIGKGRRQYVVVPLGSDLDWLEGLRAPRATATASTVQVSGAALKTKRALKLK